MGGLKGIWFGGGGLGLDLGCLGRGEERRGEERGRKERER